MEATNNHRSHAGNFKDNLRLHQEIVSRKRKVPCGVFWHLNIFEIVTEQTDDYIQAIRKEIKSDWKEEMFICFTDVKKTPEELIKRLLENQVTIIQHGDTEEFCLAKHFWRFTSIEQDNLKLLLPAVNRENDIWEEDLKEHQLNENAVMVPSLVSKVSKKEIADKTLVFSNYPPTIPSDCLKWIIETLVLYVLDKANNNVFDNDNTFGTKYSRINLTNETESSYILEKLQNQLFLLIPFGSSVESQASTSNKEASPDMDFDPPDSPSTSLEKVLTQLPDSYHKSLDVTDTADDMQHKTEELPTSDDPVIPNPTIGNRYLSKEEKIQTIILWDIQNCGVKADYVSAYVNEIRKLTITHGYYEQAFVCIDNVYKAADETIQAFRELGVTLVHLPTETKQAADKCFIDLMESFSANRRETAKIVLISGDSDYEKSIKRLKSMDRNNVFLVYTEKSKHPFFSLVETRVLHEKIKDSLKPIKSEKKNHSPLPREWEKQAKEHGVLMKFSYKYKWNGKLIKHMEVLTQDLPTKPEETVPEQWSEEKYGKKDGKYVYYTLICDNKEKAQSAHLKYGQMFSYCKIVNISNWSRSHFKNEGECSQRVSQKKESNKQPQGKRNICYMCPGSSDKKTRLVCDNCNQFVCEEHNKRLCNQCKQ